MPRPLPGSQDPSSPLARENLRKSRAVRRDPFNRRYKEERDLYDKLGLPHPEPPTRHDRERIAREREAATKLPRPHTAAHEPVEGEEREAA